MINEWWQTLKVVTKKCVVCSCFSVKSSVFGHRMTAHKDQTKRFFQNLQAVPNYKGLCWGNNAQLKSCTATKWFLFGLPSHFHLLLCNCLVYRYLYFVVNQIKWQKDLSDEREVVWLQSSCWEPQEIPNYEHWVQPNNQQCSTCTLCEQWGNKM